jgi:hypothetical protein
MPHPGIFVVSMFLGVYDLISLMWDISQVLPNGIPFLLH